MTTLRVALAQLNVTVGDVQANHRLIAEAICHAQAWLADIVVVPELAITGYPPEDLLLKPQFVEANRRVLERLVPLTRRIVALVGFVDRDKDGRLYNAAAVLSNGRHMATYHKQCLPNYGVFDEQRYFTPGTHSLILELGGVHIGVSICEDLWRPHPAQEAAACGAQLLVNLSASPYHAGKPKQREQLFTQRARANRLAIAYCNLVGGQDELVFDGASVALDARGRLLAQACQFREDFLLVDFMPMQLGPSRAGQGQGRARQGHAPHSPASILTLSRAIADRPPVCPKARSELSPIEEVYEALKLGVRDYVKKNGFSAVVLGLSGGVDSALTACIAADALGPNHVMAVVMPSRFSSEATQEDAKRVAQVLGIEAQIITIEPIFQAYLQTLKPIFGDRPEDITEQNIQARIRGNLLMALSNKFGWLVLTTGNKSEMATGYTTLYGDMAGGFAVIKDVPKTLVYQLAAFRNQRGPASLSACPATAARLEHSTAGRANRQAGPIPESVLTRAPTAELASNQTDQDTLPPYEDLDRILREYIEENRSVQEILKENRVTPSMTLRVLQMVDRSEYKRRQGPPGIKITPRAFGRDRRMPITNRYRQSE